MTIPLIPKSGDSILLDETEHMMFKQHEIVQAVESRSAKVHAKDHAERLRVSNEEGLENGPLQHPFLNKQNFDGMDEPDNRPSPVDNPLAADLVQRLELQKRLDLQERLQAQNTHTPQNKPAGF